MRGRRNQASSGGCTGPACPIARMGLPRPLRVSVQATDRRQCADASGGPCVYHVTARVVESWRTCLACARPSSGKANAEAAKRSRGHSRSCGGEPWQHTHPRVPSRRSMVSRTGSARQMAGTTKRQHVGRRSWPKSAPRADRTVCSPHRSWLSALERVCTLAVLAPNAATWHAGQQQGHPFDGKALLRARKKTIRMSPRHSPANVLEKKDSSILPDLWPRCKARLPSLY